MGNTISSSTSYVDKIQSSLKPHHVSLHPSGHHGMPCHTKTLTFCTRQKILALGTATGHIHLLGRNGVEYDIGNSTIFIIYMKFDIKGYLIVLYSNDVIKQFHLPSKEMTWEIQE